MTYRHTHAYYHFDNANQICILSRKCVYIFLRRVPLSCYKFFKTLLLGNFFFPLGSTWFSCFTKIILISAPFSNFSNFG